jgi:hypothetical protein
MNSYLSPRIVLLGVLWALSLGGMAGAAEAEARAKARPRQYVIGLSPFLDESVRDAVYRRIIGFLLEDLPVNSSLRLYDAYHVQTISQMEIPDVRAFRSAKTRANQFREPLRKLKDFLGSTHPKPSTNQLFNLSQAMRFPQFMEFVGQNLAGPDREIAVVVLGSPLYMDHKEPGFSMIDGYFPSDGHLLASREESVFGIKDSGSALKDVRVHFAYFGDPWVSEVHQEKIARFWALYLKGQGARLPVFSGDLATVFEAVGHGSDRPRTRDEDYEINTANKKIEMLRITRDVGVADWITRDVLPNMAAGPPSIRKGPMKIGIRWKGAVDLDLYATPREHAETLFFERTRSPEGYYFKDHRSSPEREFEFIEFESPVEVREVKARINFYEGNAPDGMSGDIRIEFDGRIFSGRFTLEASHGNKGRTGRNQTEFWTEIDVPEILKLPSGGDATQALSRGP